MKALKMTLISLILLLISLSEVIQCAPTKVELSANTFWLEYEYPDENSIKISMICKCQGYVAIGFGSSMTNTDMVLGQMISGAAKLTDLWSTGHTKPVEDSQNDLTNTSGSRSGDTSTFTFTRKLKTGDSKDADIVPNQRSNIIYAYGT
jgi:hypothetical protein